jgi:hypothetical protein
MKSLLAVAILSLLASPALASSETHLSINESAVVVDGAILAQTPAPKAPGSFSRALKLYRAAQMPKPSDLHGAFGGVCYMNPAIRDNYDRSWWINGVYLVGKTVKGGLIAAMVYNGGMSVEKYFDLAYYSQVRSMLLKQFDKLIVSDKMQPLVAKRESLVLRFESHEAHVIGEHSFRIASNGSIVALVNWVPANSTPIQLACSWFKRLE